MPVKTFPVPPLDANCTIVSSGTECLVVDPGFGSHGVIAKITKDNLKLKYIVCTHSHFDHAGDLWTLKNQFPEAQIVIGEQERELHANMHTQPSSFGMPAGQPQPAADLWVKDEDTLSVGDLTIQIIHSPGHSPGSICLYIPSESTLIAGDVMFRGACGRTDLFNVGSGEHLKQSIRRLLKLPASTTVITGHGSSTSIAQESRSFKSYEHYI
ncbi:hypothetical protein RCL1_008827 [Eukaryota sp. TZLM3-RCL]